MIFWTTNSRTWSLVLMVIVGLLHALSAAAASYINIPNGCAYPAPVGQWLQDWDPESQDNQVRCMQRAYDYQAWCGTDVGIASHWGERGNSWVQVNNGAAQAFSLPAKTAQLQ